MLINELLMVLAQAGETGSGFKVLARRSDRVVYLVSCPGRAPTVLKCSTRVDSLEAEYRALQLLEDTSIAPEALEFVYLGVEGAAMTETFVVGDRVSLLDGNECHMTQLLVNTLTSLYTTVPKGSAAWADGFEESLGLKLASWKRELLAHGATALAAEALYLSSALLDIGAQPHSGALLHGDLRPDNMLIVAGSLVVVDFEHSRIGDPLFDLAKLTFSMPAVATATIEAVSERLGIIATPSEIEGKICFFRRVHKLGLETWLLRRQR